MTTWTADDIFAYWGKVGRKQMSAHLAEGGRNPFAFDEYEAVLEDALHAASAGEWLAVAFRGLRTGCIAAAIDFWDDLAFRTGREATAEEVDGVARFDLEAEARVWTAIPGLAPTLVDVVTEAIVSGHEDVALRVQPLPIRRGQPVAPRHARRERIAS